MAAKLLTLRGATAPQKATRTKVDTIIVTPAIVRAWRNPEFQRPLKINDKVKALAETIKHDGVIPGMITIGVMGEVTYRVDGQHRCEAFLLSGIDEGYSDVRYHWFDTMAEMAQEFERLNSALVKMRPDDILRAREASSEAMRALRAKCPFIGYDMIRRGPKSPVLSMSAALRCWYGSETEVPSAPSESASRCADRLNMEEAEALGTFLNIAFEAWGRDAEYARVWSSHTLTIAAWIYRRTVITPYTAMTTRLTREQFRKCMMALTADERHMEWLVGRMLGDRDRSPGYNRMKGIFSKRLEMDGLQKIKLPGPAWAHGGGPGKRTAS